MFYLLSIVHNLLCLNLLFTIVRNDEILNRYSNIANLKTTILISFQEKSPSKRKRLISEEIHSFLKIVMNHSWIRKCFYYLQNAIIPVEHKFLKKIAISHIITYLIVIWKTMMQISMLFNVIIILVHYSQRQD